MCYLMTLITLATVKRGKIKGVYEMTNQNVDKYYIGAKFENKRGSPFTIINYDDSKNVTVKFERSGFEVTTNTTSISKGYVKDPFDPTVYGVGYLGVGGYSCGIGKGNRAKSYLVWSAMLSRCYNKKDRKYSVYGAVGVTVCDSWKNYQNYARWFEDNYVEGCAVDKDMSYEKVYAPENCEFIPVEINNLVVSCNKARGKHPVGVSLTSDRKKFRAYCRDGSKSTVQLGTFNDEMSAFYAYKSFKENYIKRTAETYHEAGKISKRVYNYLMRYEVVDDR